MLIFAYGRVGHAAGACPVCESVQASAPRNEIANTHRWDGKAWRSLAWAPPGASWGGGRPQWPALAAAHGLMAAAKKRCDTK